MTEAGWLGWLGEMMPEEWAEQFAAKPVLGRPLVISMDALGLMADDPQRLLSAAAYLKGGEPCLG